MMAGVFLLCFATAIACCSCAAIGESSSNFTDEITDKDTAGTNFKLYTKSNPNSPVTITAANLKSEKEFNAKRQTKIVVHGWHNSAENLDDIRQAYVKSGGDYNIVMVDWSVGAASNYIVSRRMVITVGETLASLIEAMVHLGASTNNIQIAGHSLGAHIAGIASDKAGKVARVIGLDPAAPGFGTVATSGRLDKGDAHFVEVIHSDAGVLGWESALGHADFYPNGGKALQPGCWVNQVGCSHGRSKQFFAESITSGTGFWAVQCANYATFALNRCQSNAEALMGEKTPTSASGSFFLKTKSSSPYAMGKSGA